jgi:hypothetical protein
LGTDILGRDDEKEAQAAEAICGVMRNHPDDFSLQETGARKFSAGMKRRK